MSQITAAVMNPEVKAAIEAFAKSRNVSPAACLQAAAIALVMQPFEEVGSDNSDIVTVSPQKDATAVKRVTKSAKRIPRQAGEQSLKFRQDVIDKADTLKGKRYTFAEVGAMFGLDQANTSNNLKWLQKQKKVDFRVVGAAAKAQGQKGRAPAIIEFV